MSSHKGCDNYQWNASSAMRKATSDMSVSMGVGFLSVTKQLTGSNDASKDAYRNCVNCNTHANYHKK
ncbi:hypothetical protein BMW23_0299 [Bodo saltans virus]|uniref:Uncharacterized protein n=1 Tax=Bodo saltans virus TaxID=2024608 RepID=A0A2H4UU31_9VIRU|nr:hypothetical protein QJ851_gp0294 [Bodo saltans virus]ATZ80357.1 hypothetical protein BMW23_0299 [Bodo saltans virus]